MSDFYTLSSDSSSLVIDCRSKLPAILYWGARLDAATTPEMLVLLATRQEARASVAEEATVALSPSLALGFPGDAGIQVHRNGRDWAVHATIDEVVEGESALTIRSSCKSTQVAVEHDLALDADSGVLIARTRIRNLGDAPLSVDRCNAPAIPLPDRFRQITGFEGRWANEFQTHRVARYAGAYLRENRAGRTSHKTFPGLIVHTDDMTEHQGSGYGLHLGWSGNYRLRVDEFGDGRSSAQLGELFLPGEMTLAPGESYESPLLYGASSDAGFNRLSQAFHRYVRARLTDERVQGKLKPVHFNSWEAIYFDLSLDKLKPLVDAAADAGAERFVLDDGWFPGRNDDTAGLGDWYVDTNKFPDGLHPLVSYVHEQGMEFGLWVEPEMVNPDSELYRQHPDWALSAGDAPVVLSRHQLVLDLARAEVSDYLFERIDNLLSEYPITYLKWDMNRNLEQPGGADGRASVHRQTLAVYALMARLRRAHPKVEIESCSSGGARADFGVLAHTDRVWTSDSNDPLDRLSIQRGFSMFFPAEVMGAHVGPRHCHITGRTTSMAFRAGVALFGDMGIEANLLEVNAEELAVLKEAVALHKKHRALIFSGDLYRLETDDSENAFGIVAADKSEALCSWAQVGTMRRSLPGRLMFAGLASEARYKVELIWPAGERSWSTSVLDAVDGQALSGESLMRAGMQLPIVDPESLLVFHLVQV